MPRPDEGRRILSAAAASRLRECRLLHLREAPSPRLWRFWSPDLKGPVEVLSLACRHFRRPASISSATLAVSVRLVIM